MVGENLRNDSVDVLRSPATVNVWDRFIVGNDSPTSETVELRKIVLRHIALFERFGFESPVECEAQFVAELASKCDSRMTWPRFQSLITELKQRRIVQGTTTLYITPGLLRFYLFRQFWDEHGRGIDLAQLLAAMPQQLWHWMVEMLRYAHMSPVASRAVDKLLGHDGLFPDGPFPESVSHGQLIMALAETNPEPTLRCLERTVGSMDKEQLRL